jgi:hypothetical protein
MARDRSDQFQALFLPAVAAEKAGVWQPLLDIYQTLTVIVEGRRLTIRGVRRDCSVEEGCCHYLMEIAYSRFERTVELPDDLTNAHIETDFRDGMLMVRISKGK